LLVLLTRLNFLLGGRNSTILDLHLVTQISLQLSVKCQLGAQFYLWEFHAWVFSPKGGGGNKQKRRKHGKNPPESVIFSSISPPTDTRYQGGPFEFWKSGCFPCGKSGGIADFPPISWTCRLGALTGEQLGPPSCWPVSDPQRPAAGQSAAWLTGQLPQQASWAAYQQATWKA
jgi:hypothetical protein